VLADADLGELFDDHAPPVAAEEVLGRSRFAYRCDQCDRLHLFWAGLETGRPPSTHLRARESRPGVRSCRCPAVRQ